ncbi:MAG: FHA domain-containing protein [Polyangiales bacterium]
MTRFRLRIQFEEYDLGVGETVIGRGVGCHLTIDDPLLSREHAALKVDERRATIRDLGSRNGTFVNGERLRSEVELHHGDRILLGRLEAVFSRMLGSRRDVATTARIRPCMRCSRPYVSAAPSCPNCGEPALEGRSPRSESRRQRDFWLALEVELVEKALSLFRLTEAEESVTRMAEKLDALIASSKDLGDDELQAALCAAVRFAHAKGTAKPIAWALGMSKRLGRLPGPELFTLLASTPPILLEEASDALIALVAAHHARTDLGVVEQSCLRSLDKLGEELHSFRLQRWEPSRASPSLG